MKYIYSLSLSLLLITQTTHPMKLFWFFTFLAATSSVQTDITNNDKKIALGLASTMKKYQASYNTNEAPSYCNEDTLANCFNCLSETGLETLAKYLQKYHPELIECTNAGLPQSIKLLEDDLDIAID